MKHPIVSDVGIGHDGGCPPLLDLLDSFVDERGRVAAAEALGVNYRSMMTRYISWRVSRRMRQALGEFRDSLDMGDDGPGVVNGDGVGEDAGESREVRAARLEQENRKLRETVASQAEELEALRRQLAELEERDQSPGETNVVAGSQGQPVDWRPPQRGHGLADAGVVTFEEQPDEEHAFGPSAPLVA